MLVKKKTYNFKLTSQILENSLSSEWEQKNTLLSQENTIETAWYNQAGTNTKHTVYKIQSNKNYHNQPV